MVGFRRSGGNDKNSPGMVAAIAKQFRGRKPTLQRRLQYYEEEKRELEMYKEIKDIKLYLQIMEDKLMIETHGISNIQDFLTKTHEMDHRNPIPENWTPKTSVPPCRNVYDPTLEWDAEKRQRYERYLIEGEKWGEPAQFPSRMSRKDMHNSSRRYQHANQNRGESRGRRQSRPSAAEGRYQDDPRTSRRSSSRPRAASRSVNQQQRRKQSSNNDPNWLQEDYNPRRRNCDRGPSQPNGSPPRNGAGRGSVSRARSKSARREPPRQQYPIGLTSTNMPQPFELLYSPNGGAPIVNFANQGETTVRNYFNGPLPPSIYPSGNNIYFPLIIGQQISRSRSRSRHRPALCYPQQPRFPETFGMRPAINYDNLNRTSKTPPPRRRDSIATSAYRRERNYDIPRDFDRNRRCSTARSRDNEGDRRSKSRTRQSSTPRSRGVRQRLRTEASKEEFYKLGQREKKRENGTDEAQKRREKARNPAGTNAAVGKATENVGHWENMAIELLGKGQSSQRNNKVEPSSGNGKVKARKVRKEEESSGVMTRNKTRLEKKAGESHVVDEPEEGLVANGIQTEEARSGEMTEANANETSNHETDAEMPEQVGTNDEILGEQQELQDKVQLVKSPGLEDNNGGKQITITEQASSLENAESDTTSNHSESSEEEYFPSENELDEPIAGPSSRQKQPKRKRGRKPKSTAKVVSPVEDNNSSSEGESANRYMLRSKLKRKPNEPAKQLVAISLTSRNPEGNKRGKSQPGPSSERTEDDRMRKIMEKSLEMFKPRFTKSKKSLLGNSGIATNAGPEKVSIASVCIPLPPTSKENNDSGTDEEEDDDFAISPETLLKFEEYVNRQYNSDQGENDDTSSDEEGAT